ncbi:hypothetical protein M407DRAFT_5546 [Tulasnella calospora MUT 4182]|uniref:WW domain-containing protein n=1 Tax=Tulasnella calospora MUT 4182 TaxID=1051891 RepID=A0A0C3MAB0_9AGAM|nr:hypothetical protein M407DRAFT_5546 [Tulasnella calospora MUT 4182]
MDGLLRPILPDALQETFQNCRQGTPTSDQQPLPYVHGLLPLNPAALIPSRGYPSGFWILMRHLNGDRYFYNPVGRAFTLFDPREAGNGVVLQNAIDRILQHLDESNISDDFSIVLGLTNGAQGTQKITYYLVNNDRQAVFWLEDVTNVILRRSLGHAEECLPAKSEKDRMADIGLLLSLICEGPRSTAPNHS